MAGRGSVDLVFCPPGLRGTGPWCRSIPCHGHRETAPIIAVAKVLSRQSDQRLGWPPEPWNERPQSSRRMWLAQAKAELWEASQGA